MCFVSLTHTRAAHIDVVYSWNRIDWLQSESIQRNESLMQCISFWSAYTCLYICGELFVVCGLVVALILINFLINGLKRSVICKCMYTLCNADSIIMPFIMQFDIHLQHLSAIDVLTYILTFEYVWYAD